MKEERQYKFDSEAEDSIPLDMSSLSTQPKPNTLYSCHNDLPYLKSQSSPSPPFSNHPTNYYYININHPELSNNNKINETNIINTSKYTWYSIIPKILIEQFSKMANVYFLIIAILQSIKEISYSGGIPVILLPLTFVICINGIKDIFEDFKRKKSDNEENNRECEVYDSSQFTFIKKKWKNILLGEIVKVFQNEPFPADILLINSAEEHGICYIETQNLDGETSLKYRHSNPQLRKYYYSPSEFNRVNKIIQTSFPNEQIYEFEGKIFDMAIDTSNNKGKIIHENIYDTIDKNSLLLRGCYLKQTEYIIGVTVYLGHNTKSMKNAPNPRTKTSKIEDIMNFQIIVIFLFQLSLSFLAAICNCLMYKNNVLFLKEFIYLHDVDYHSFAVIFTRAGTWLLIFTNLVPISLLVTMEMIKFIQGIFISWDIDLYDAKRNLCAKVQTSTLNEELGQVKFIFTDKTGTLTKNHMTFKKMMIGKELFGENEFYHNSIELKGKDYDIGENMSQRQCYNDKYGTITNTDYIDYAKKLQKNCENYNEDIYHFMECICLCHSVITDVKLFQAKQTLLYQASSPDEMALVSFARQAGFIFKERSIDNIITLEIQGKIIRYEILCLFEYTSERKRMSIIVRCPDGKIRLYIKGADSIISKLIVSSHKELLKYNEEALLSFAKEGLRTLMIAYKEIQATSFDYFICAYRKIISDGKDKERQMALLYNSIETQLMLLGVTAIEDQLQDNVDETLDFFISSGIKVWMLTGDKMDTAKSVAFSCRLISHEYSLIEIPEKASVKIMSEMIKLAIQKYHNHKKNKDKEEKYAILISSNELDILFDKENLQLRNNFYYLSLKSQCVICSRVTPKQKAELVTIIKEYQKGTVLAIGDGANDVKMITKADVGIGIMGLEGTQAARASDYSITSFSHLKKLMFVHGRESYRKNSFVICYNFYKNALFVMPQFWMGILNFYSGQTLFDKWIYQLFNPIFTCLPIIWYGIYDTELSQHDLLYNSLYYMQGMSSKLFHSFRFWKWIAYGILQGLLIFLFAFMTLRTPGSDGRMQDMWSIGTMAYSFIVLIASLTVVIYTNSHTWVSVIVIALSIVSYYIAVVIMSEYTCFSNFNNSLMIFLDLRFYYETVALCVLVVLLSIGVSKIMIYYGVVQDDGIGVNMNKMKGSDVKSNYSDLSNHSKDYIQVEEEEIKDIVEKNKYSGNAFSKEELCY